MSLLGSRLSVCQKPELSGGNATLYKQPLERGRSEDLARSHGFFVRVRGRLINLYEADFAVGPELRHGTLTRFRMEVNADNLDEQVASARENLKAVSYTHLTLPTKSDECRSRWSPYH